MGNEMFYINVNEILQPTSPESVLQTPKNVVYTVMLQISHADFVPWVLGVKHFPRGNRTALSSIACFISTARGFQAQIFSCPF